MVAAYLLCATHAFAPPTPALRAPTALREANLSEPLAGVREGWWRTPTGAGLVAGEGVCACSFG